jgi:hypothetical protein
MSISAPSPQPLKPRAVHMFVEGNERSQAQLKAALLCHTCEPGDEADTFLSAQTLANQIANPRGRGAVTGSTSNPCCLEQSIRVVPGDARESQPRRLQPPPCRSQAYSSGCISGVMKRRGKGVCLPRTDWSCCVIISDFSTHPISPPSSTETPLGAPFCSSRMGRFGLLLLGMLPVTLRCQSSRVWARNLPAAGRMLGGGVARICRSMNAGCCGRRPIHKGSPVTRACDLYLGRVF